MSEAQTKGPLDLQVTNEETPAYLLSTQPTSQTLGSRVLPNEGIQIFVKTLDDNIIALEVEWTDSAQQVKALIHKREGVPPECLRVTYGGRQLDDGSTLADYKVEKGSTLNLALRLRGGAEAWPEKLPSSAKDKMSAAGLEPSHWRDGEWASLKKLLEADPPISAGDVVKCSALHKCNASIKNGGEGRMEIISEIRNLEGSGTDPKGYPKKRFSYLGGSPFKTRYEAEVAAVAGLGNLPPEDQESMLWSLDPYLWVLKADENDFESRLMNAFGHFTQRGSATARRSDILFWDQRRESFRNVVRSFMVIFTTSGGRGADHSAEAYQAKLLLILPVIELAMRELTQVVRKLVYGEMIPKDHFRESTLSKDLPAWVRLLARECDKEKDSTKEKDTPKNPTNKRKRDIRRY